MSAVVGFRCRNGIVLCAHQQASASGVLIPNGRRITIEVEPHQSMVLACSGLPAETSEFREEIRKKLGNAEIPSDLLYLAVNEVLTDMCGQSPSMDLQLLIGRAAASEYPTLLEFTGKALHVAGDVSFLGGGISPVPRFLAATMFSPQMDIEEATNLAIYLTHKAAQYMDNCEGALNTAVMKCGDQSSRILLEEDILKRLKIGISNLVL